MLWAPLYAAPTLDVSIAARMCSTHICRSHSCNSSGVSVAVLISFLHLSARASRRALSLAEQAGREGEDSSFPVVPLAPFIKAFSLRLLTTD